MTTLLNKKPLNKTLLNQTLLPTSTAGSLPKPVWLAEPQTLWSPWKLQGEELIAGKHDALRLSLQDQLHAGIDIVSDGEQTRQHFVLKDPLINQP